MVGHAALDNLSKLMEPQIGEKGISHNKVPLRFPDLLGKSRLLEFYFEFPDFFRFSRSVERHPLTSLNINSIQFS